MKHGFVPSSLSSSAIGRSGGFGLRLGGNSDGYRGPQERCGAALRSRASVASFRVPVPPFARFLLRRAAALVLLSLGITLVAFALTQLVPSDPVAANLGEQAAADPAAVQAFRERYGLDEPIPVQYWRYLENLLQGDLGESLQDHEPVRDNLARYVPATAELAILSTVIAVLVGMTFGVVAAVRRNRLTDHLLRVFSLAGISMPTFWIALVALYLFFYRFGWFPGGDRLDPGVLAPPRTTGMYTIDALLAGQWSTAWDALHHLILPALVLAAYNVGLLTRYTRTAVLEVIENDYVRAARAKGLPEPNVLVRHVLRGALPSVVTVIGLVFANVLTGTVLVETIFSWPGIGQYAYRSAVTLDLPAIMGVSLFVAVVYVSINFVVDVLYGIIDPRIRVT
jgi:peptide/nickel transport system permease protein